MEDLQGIAASSPDESCVVVHSNASTSQPTGSRGSTLSRLKNKFSRNQKSKGEKISINRRSQNGAAINHERQPQALNKESTASLSASAPVTAIEDNPHSSGDVPSTTIEKIHPSLQNSLTADPLCSIHELWNEAYDVLKEQEKELITDYEAILCSDLATMIGSRVIFSSSKLERKDQMSTFLDKKIETVKENTWKLKFCGKDVPLKDLAKPVIGIIQYVFLEFRPSFYGSRVVAHSKSCPSSNVLQVVEQSKLFPSECLCS